MALAEFAARDDASLRIGYFHGGRNMLLYRAMDDGAFERRGVDVTFWSTMDDTDPVFYQVPRRIPDLVDLRRNRAGARHFAHTTGPQIAVELMSGRLHCGMLGESTFLEGIDQGRAWHAVAKLGQGAPGTPAQVVIMRPGLDVQGPEQLKGLRLGTRRSGLYDRAMVRAWLRHVGVDPAEVRIQDDIPQVTLIAMLRAYELDLAFVHLRRATHAIDKWGYQVVPGFSFDFADPTLSESLLVCRDEVISSRREQIVAFLEAYKRRIDYEHGLGAVERAAVEGDKAYGMDLDDIDGFDLPKHSARPVVEAAPLEAMQAILYAQGFLPRMLPVAPYLDNSLMEEALARVAAQRPVPYPGAAPAH